MLYSRSLNLALLAAAATTSTVLAQTSTDCNPLLKTCSSDAGLASSTFNTDFTSSHSGWTTVGSGVSYSSSGAAFTITADGQAPTIQLDDYIFFGRVDVVMESSPGTGIVSSIVLLSDDLDEIDWEFLGGDATHVQTNFFGKGDTSSYDRVTYVSIANSQTAYHTYSIDWTAERIQWLIDGTVVRTLLYTDALASSGKLFPQTPARVKIGNWVAGGANNAAGTVAWAGGKTDFSAAPFVMNVKSVSVTNYNPGSSYSYSDTTGSWKSIVISGGSSSGASSSSASASTASTSTSSTSKSTTSVAATSSSTTVAKSSSTSVVVVSLTTTLATSTTSASSGSVSSTTTTTGSRTSTSTSAAYASYTGAASSLHVGTGSLVGLAAAAALLI